MFPFSIVFRFVLHWAANPRTLWNPSTPSHIVVIVAERFVCRFMRRIHHVLSHCAIIPNINPMGRAIRKCFVVALSLSRFFLVSCASRTLTIVRVVFFILLNMLSCFAHLIELPIFLDKCGFKSLDFHYAITKSNSI